MPETKTLIPIKDIGNGYLEVWAGGEHARIMKRDKYERLIHQTPQTILKSDGWIPKKKVDNNGNHPSHLTTSPRKLRLISACEAIEASTLGIQPLWGNFLYEKSITILNSVAGVGKTTLCYNLAIHGAKGELFANIPFSKQLNVLYVDLETSRELRATKLRRICEEHPPGNLYFLSSLNFITDYDELKAIVLEKSIDLLIVDTINESFDTRDEQDNAEANRQFAYVKRLRDEAGCSIILLAHIGKGEQSKKVYSTRGASSRAGTADVVINLEEKTQDEICLSKEKDRIGGGKEKLYLRKAGEDAFEVIEKGEDQEVSQIIRAEQLILSLFDDGVTRTCDFVERGKQQSYSKPTIERALANLTDVGKIDRVKKGVYQKKSDKSEPSNSSGDDLISNGSNVSSKNPSITNNYRGDGFDGLLSNEVSG